MEKSKIEVCVLIEHVTKKAYLVTNDPDSWTAGQWVPKSQVKLDQDGGPDDTVVMNMPEWLAIDKGFV